MLRFGGIADRGGDARIGHRDHHVGIHGGFARQQPAQHFARFLHRAAEDNRIRARKIDVLENAMRVVAHRSVALPRHSFGADDDHFAGFDIAQVDRADQVERAGFRREHVAHAPARKLHLPERERAEAVRIASDDDAVIGEKNQGKCAFQLEQGFAQSARQRALARAGHQMQDHFGIAGSLEDRAFPLQFAAQFGRVGDVAVVRHRELALVAGHRERLGIEQNGIAGGRIAGVADGEVARQAAQDFRREQIRHVAHALVEMEMCGRRSRRCRRFPGRDAASAYRPR